MFGLWNMNSVQKLQYWYLVAKETRIPIFGYFQLEIEYFTRFSQRYLIFKMKSIGIFFLSKLR